MRQASYYILKRDGGAAGLGRGVGLALAAALAVAGAAQGAELGDVKVSSFIGQPLVADVELVALTPDDMDGVRVRPAPPDVYRMASISMHPALATLSLSVMRREQRQFLHITSLRQIDADYVNMYLELTSGNKTTVRAVTIWLAPEPPPAPRPAAPARPPPAVAAAPAAVPAAPLAPSPIIAPVAPIVTPRAPAVVAPAPAVAHPAPAVTPPALAAASPASAAPAPAASAMPAPATARAALVAAIKQGRLAIPAEPAKPAEPVKPVEAAKPSEAVKPVAADKPTEPRKPAEPGKSTAEADKKNAAISKKLIELEGKVKLLQAQLMAGTETLRRAPAHKPEAAAAGSGHAEAASVEPGHAVAAHADAAPAEAAKPQPKRKLVPVRAKAKTDAPVEKKAEPAGLKPTTWLGIGTAVLLVVIGATVHLFRRRKKNQGAAPRPPSKYWVLLRHPFRRKKKAAFAAEAEGPDTTPLLTEVEQRSEPT